VFRCPVSQQVIGDALGLSVVHVNRSLRRLAESGVLQKRSGEVEVLDDAAFEQIGRD
jgi:CRP-like cAMP-binding protein